MLEVYTGFRPGRPRVLLMLSASILVGSLGLAWWQVRDARALTAPVPIDGTPLVVRAPRGWLADSRHPGTFYRPVRGRNLLGGQEWSIERQLRIGYRRLPGFYPARELPFLLGLVERGGVVDERPAKIGKFDAIEVHAYRQVRIGRRNYDRERIVRVASLPRGDIVFVDYVPLTSLTLGDRDVLDDVCRAIRIDDADLTIAPAAALAAAGMTFALDGAWRVARPSLPGVPAIHIAGSVGGMPAWSLDVYRTWLAEGRTPRDLVVDFGGWSWLVPPEKLVVEEMSRADGAAIAHVRAADPDRDDRMQSAWAIASSPTQAAMIYVSAAPDELDVAHAAARRVIDSIRFEPLAGFPDLARAARAGRELTARLGQLGAVPRWGAAPVSVRYRGTTPRGDEVRLIGRSPVGRGARDGYRGEESVQHEGGKDTIRWELDQNVAAYRFEYRARWAGKPMEVIERRRAPDALVERTVRIGNVEWTRRFAAGALFVPPPAESIVEGWVARGEHGPCLVEFSVLFGSGTCSYLLEPLPAENDHPRVLVRRDFWPVGVMISFDESDAEPSAEVSETYRYHRVE